VSVAWLFLTTTRMKPRPCSSQGAGGFFRAHADEESLPRSFGQYSVAGGPSTRRRSPPWRGSAAGSEAALKSCGIADAPVP
jgi:hypothetical protein